MEQPQGPQYIPGSQQPPYPQQPQQPQTGYQQPQPQQYPPYVYNQAAPRGSRFGRTLRLLSLRTASGSAGLGRRLRPHWLLAIVVTILVGIIGVESFILLLPVLLRIGTAQPNGRVESIPPAPAVESFIKGQREYNADLIWDSFSQDLKDSMQEQGNSPTALQNQMERERSSGQHYVTFDYIGGLRTRDGNSKFFYFAEVESSDPSSSGPRPYVFTVNGDGKIVEFTAGNS